MLDKIFWIITANKIRIFIWKNKILTSLNSFILNYIKTFKSSWDNWKFYLVVWPILNLFLFSWFFPFLIIIISDFIIIKKINK